MTKETQSKHTPTPLYVEQGETHRPYILAVVGSQYPSSTRPAKIVFGNPTGGQDFPAFSDEMILAIARHIVHCVNVFDEVVEAAEIGLPYIMSYSAREKVKKALALAKGESNE